MTAHRHAPLDRTDLLAAATAVLAEAGERMTPMRAAVLGVLLDNDSPCSAYDVAQGLAATRGKAVAPASVYRILDLFVDHALAQKVESRNAYMANRHPGCPHDCIYLLCDRCGAATHLDDDELTTAVRAVAERSGFRPVRPVVEVRGLCGACA